jgi:hypothetical protein
VQHKEQFQALTQRIDTLLKDPTSIRAPFTRLASPFLRRFGWQPKPSIDRTQDLWQSLKPGQANADIEQIKKWYQAAILELAENVKAAERSFVIYRKVPIAYIAWLQRLQVMLENVERFLEDPNNEILQDVACGTELVTILPPLSVQEDALPDAPAPLPLSVPGSTTSDAPEEKPDDEMTLSVELGAVDHLIQLSQRETNSINRRRSFLEAGRRFLLEASAAIPLEQNGVQQRLNHIAREMIRLNRLQATGLSADVSLLHQARTAVSRGDRQLLYSSLLALDTAAKSMRDMSLVGDTRSSLQSLVPPQPTSPEETRRSLLNSAVETLGASTMEIIQRAYDEALHNLPITNETPAAEARAFREYFQEGSMEQTLFAILSTDGLFEVGGALSPVKIVEQETFLTQVRTPTQRMSLEQSRDVQDVPNSIMEDPRTVLFSLATGRLLTRRFLREQVRPKTRVVMRSEARIYILDGSGSMLGPRARMRDAILVAELVTLQKRLKTQSKYTRSTIYYRYFNDKLGPVHKVDNEASIHVALDHILSRIRTGGTDIDLALVNSFTQIREAKSLDPNLAQAQIVLITDGDAKIDEAAIAEARDGLDDLPIGVSVIALGMENPALKDLVAKQRAKGEDAFYHFVPDDMLRSYCNGTADPQTLHIPPSTQDPQRESRELQSSIGHLLDEMAVLERKRDIESIERLDAEAAARKEMGIEDQSLCEGERAKIEERQQNWRALQLRFERWFPMNAGDSAQTEMPSGQDQREIEAIQLIHAALCEMIGVVGGSELTRKSDSIELLERLLVDARITPRRYEDLMTKFRSSFARGLTSLHQTITPKQEKDDKPKR